MAFQLRPNFLNTQYYALFKSIFTKCSLHLLAYVLPFTRVNVAADASVRNNFHITISQ
jgi:hypothetical protein